MDSDIREKESAHLVKGSNLPNLITLSRFAIAPIVILLLITDELWAGILSAILIFIAGMSDIVDGYLARHWKSVTEMGKLLDPVADKVLVVAALIMLVGLGRVHPILVVIIVSREILITGIRAIAGSYNVVISAATSGKYKTTFQMIAIGALSVHETVLGVNAHIVGLLFLYLSIGFSLYSAIEYIRLFLKELNSKLI